MSEKQQPRDASLPPAPIASSESSNFPIQEYSALRAEILKRTEIQHQLLSIAVIALGTFLTVVTKDGGPTTVLLAYPILAMFLSLAWCQSDGLIGLLGKYIKERMENNKPGWETYLHETTTRKLTPLSVSVAAGIFVGTQIMSLTVYVFQAHFSKLSKDTALLLLIDVLVIVSTAFLLKYRSRLSSQ